MYDLFVGLAYVFNQVRREGHSQFRFRSAVEFSNTLSNCDLPDET